MLFFFTAESAEIAERIQHNYIFLRDLCVLCGENDFENRLISARGGSAFG
jgi:hypothetical protein